MALTNYPQGLTSFGLPLVGSGQIQASTGTYFFVSSVTGKSGNDGLSPDTPLSTIDGAVNKCTAAKNDVIVVMPGHAETLTAAAGIACDISGVTIIGLGNGANRPVITFGTATTASIAISAANVRILNIVGVAGIDALSQPFDVTANDCTLDIEWRDGSATVEAARAVLATTVSRLNVKIKYLGFTAGDAVVNAVRLNAVTGANIDINAYGVCTTAWVEMVTTASTNVQVNGVLYTQAITNFSRDVVDTITGSTWEAQLFDASAGASVSGGSAAALASDDVSTIASNMNVPTADVTTNTLERDVVGNKTDAGVTAVGTTKTIIAYAKGLVTMATVQSADSTNNAFAGDVVGNKTDASVYTPGTTKSLAAYAKGTANLQENVVAKAAAVMVNGNTIFTIAGGPIKIEALWSECVTANDATASTLQYSCTPTVGSATTISAASASLANAAAGASVALAGTALSTAALLAANGPNLIANPGTVVAPAGTITMVIGVGSTTGTWRHYMRYKPLAVGVTVS